MRNPEEKKKREIRLVGAVELVASTNPEAESVEAAFTRLIAVILKQQILAKDLHLLSAGETNESKPAVK